MANGRVVNETSSCDVPSFPLRCLVPALRSLCLMGRIVTHATTTIGHAATGEARHFSTRNVPIFGWVCSVINRYFSNPPAAKIHMSALTRCINVQFFGWMCNQPCQNVFFPAHPRAKYNQAAHNTPSPTRTCMSDSLRIVTSSGRPSDSAAWCTITVPQAEDTDWRGYLRKRTAPRIVVRVPVAGGETGTWTTSS